MAKKFLTPVGLLEKSSDPTSGSPGDIYFNTSSNVLRIFYSSSWNNIKFSSSSTFASSVSWAGVSDKPDPVLTVLLSGDISGTASTVFTDLGNASLTLNTAVLTASTMNVDHIDFSTTASSTASVARLQWSAGEGTLTFGLGGGNVYLDIGQEQVAYCYNGTGSALTKGTVVYISGAQGQRPSLSKASSSQESTSSKVLGVTAETIADGAEGFVATFGILRDVDTSAYSPGTALWLSSTPGEITSTKVYAPNNLVFVGYSIKQSETAGQIFLSPQNGFELYELHNVSASNPNNNDILYYNTSGSIWQTASIQSLITNASVGYSNVSASSTVSSSARISSSAVISQDSTRLNNQLGSYYLDTSSTAQTKSGNLYVSGLLGVGTTSPGAKLNVRGGSILLDNANSIWWGYGDGSTLIYGDATAGTGRLGFSTGGVERFSILNSGTSSFINQVIFGSSVTGGNATFSGNIVASVGTTTLGATTLINTSGINFSSTNANEGGQINLLGGSSYSASTMQIDNYQGNLRILSNSGNTTAVTVANANGLVTIGSGGLTSSAGTTNLGTVNAGNITSTGSVVASIVHANSNGAGTNFRVGDDVWIGDINLADTISIRGISGASSNGYIRFGSDNNSLGYNGSIFSYAQGIVLSPQIVRLDAVRTKPTNDTSLEPIFDSANDTISIDAGSLYYFKGIFQISKTATGTAAGIQLGFTFSNSPQVVNYKYSSHTQVIGTVQGGLGTANTATTVTATGTGAANYVIEIEGWFKSNATTGGTFAPTFTQSVAGTSSAPTANANSWFMIQKMSSTATTTNITGGWS